MATRNKRPALAGAGQLSMLFGADRSTTHSPDLITIAPPSVHFSATSRRAAALIVPQLGRLERLVLKTLQHAGPQGLTDTEIQQRLNLAGDTQRPRRVRLVELGWVIDSGRRRMTRSGRAAAVWIVVERPEVAA